MSGAYHDAMVLASKVPIGMILVPVVGAISRSTPEFTAAEEIDRGLPLLAAALRRIAGGS
jgi:hypothetical protein